MKKKYLTAFGLAAVVGISDVLGLQGCAAGNMAKAYGNVMAFLGGGSQAGGNGRLGSGQEQDGAGPENGDMEDPVLATLKNLAETCSSGDREDIWRFISGGEYKKLVEDLPQMMEYADENGRYLQVYPCGHLYYGELADKKREGLGLWAGCCRHEGYEHYHGDETFSFDFFWGEWEGDYPNGKGELVDSTNGIGREVTVLRNYFRNGYSAGRGFQIYMSPDEGEKSYDYQVDYGNPDYGVPCAKKADWKASDITEEEKNQFWNDAHWSSYKGWTESPGDVTGQGASGHVRLVTNGVRGDVVQYNPEKQCFIAWLEYGKGADVREVLMDKDGNVLAYGYSEGLWMTENGYARIKYCYGDTEQEAEYSNSPSDVYKVAMGEIEGCAYVQLFDWSGTIVESKKLGDNWQHWIREAYEVYPAKEFAADPVDVECRQDADGFLVVDSEGKEIGHIEMADAGSMKPQVIGNLLVVYEWNEERSYTGECKRIYWIQ